MQRDSWLALCRIGLSILAVAEQNPKTCRKRPKLVRNQSYIPVCVHTAQLLELKKVLSGIPPSSKFKAISVRLRYLCCKDSRVRFFLVDRKEPVKICGCGYQILTSSCPYLVSFVATISLKQNEKTGFQKIAFALFVNAIFDGDSRPRFNQIYVSDMWRLQLRVTQDKQCNLRFVRL